MDCRSRSVLTRITTTGDRDSTLLEWKVEDARYRCRSVDQGQKIDAYYGMGWEHYPVLICHDLKKPLSEAWFELQVWD